MDHMERVERLRTMLRQVSPHGDLESLRVPAAADGAADESAQPTPRGPAAQSPGFGINDALSGMRKLKDSRDSEINPSELMGLEAIVLRAPGCAPASPPCSLR